MAKAFGSSCIIATVVLAKENHSFILSELKMTQIEEKTFCRAFLIEFLPPKWQKVLKMK